MKNQIKRFITNPKIRFGYLTRIGIYNKISDKKFIEKKYKLDFGKPINWSNPKTFNEKMQWLKIYNRKPIFTTMVDKYEAKKYVSAKIGKEYIVPTIGIYDKFDDIDIEKLPNQFVIKCTHDSGGLIICKDKTTFNISEAKKKINKYLKRKFYFIHREWPYKNVKPRIIIEKYLIDKETKELRDYKFFCFNGEVKYFKIDFNRFAKHQANYYNRDGVLQKFGEEAFPPDYKKHLRMPKNLNLMITFAEKIAKNTPFLRVDFYEVNGKVYFGEITFYPSSGFGKFTPEEWDKKLGDLIDLKLAQNEK